MLINQQINNKSAVKPRFYMYFPDQLVCLTRGSSTLVQRS